MRTVNTTSEMDNNAPVCRFGPGGEFSWDWPTPGQVVDLEGVIRLFEAQREKPLGTLRMVGIGILRVLGVQPFCPAMSAVPTEYVVAPLRSLAHASQLAQGTVSRQGPRFFDAENAVHQEPFIARERLGLSKPFAWHHDMRFPLAGFGVGRFDRERSPSPSGRGRLEQQSLFADDIRLSHRSLRRTVRSQKGTTEKPSRKSPALAPAGRPSDNQLTLFEE